MAIPTLVLYEWLRGPRLPSEMLALHRFIRPESVTPFGVDEAKVAADLYIAIGRSRSRARSYDIGIAACAVVRNAPLWTLNPRDFQDIPQLRLYTLP
jgi:predicted nucleic acid-binding protein